jgi:hypothetical protein
VAGELHHPPGEGGLGLEAAGERGLLVGGELVQERPFEQVVVAHGAPDRRRSMQSRSRSFVRLRIA